MEQAELFVQLKEKKAVPKEGNFAKIRELTREAVMFVSKGGEK